MKNQHITARDNRYSIRMEYTGEGSTRYVARFCGGWVGAFTSADDARRACDDHYRARMAPFN